MYTYNYKSPIGFIQIKTSENSIKTLKFIESINNTTEGLTLKHPYILKECIEQLDRYFRGKLEQFSLNLDIHGTNFQKKVWNALLQIPLGKTYTYAEIAKTINTNNAYRAVGLANKKNPLLIIVPCHRVINSNGKLSGYVAGASKKQWLINHEKNIINNL